MDTKYLRCALEETRLTNLLSLYYGGMEQNNIYSSIRAHQNVAFKSECELFAVFTSHVFANTVCLYLYVMFA